MGTIYPNSPNWDYRKSYAADPNAGGIVFDAIPNQTTFVGYLAMLSCWQHIKVGDLDLLSADYK